RHPLQPRPCAGGSEAQQRGAGPLPARSGARAELRRRALQSLAVAGANGPPGGGAAPHGALPAVAAAQIAATILIHRQGRKGTQRKTETCTANCVSSAILCVLCGEFTLRYRADLLADKQSFGTHVSTTQGVS